MPNTPLLYRAVYFSTAARPLSPAEVHGLATNASRANWRDGVTGSLIFTGGHFAQWLEGAHDQVLALLDRIGSDPRHTEMKLVHERPVERRQFAQWGMRYVYNLDLDDLLDEAHRLESGPVLQDVLRRIFLDTQLDDLNPSI